MYVYNRTRVSYRGGEEVPWDSSPPRGSVLQPSRTVTLCSCNVFRNTNFGLCFIWNKHPAIILETLYEGEAYATGCFLPSIKHRNAVNVCHYPKGKDNSQDGLICQIVDDGLTHRQTDRQIT